MGRMVKTSPGRLSHKKAKDSKLQTKLGSFCRATATTRADFVSLDRACGGLFSLRAKLVWEGRGRACNTPF